LLERWIFEWAKLRTRRIVQGMSELISKRVCQRLEKVARQSADQSYSPYSRFRVGAAVLASSGKIYGGCNVENASYGLCNCAERTAIFSAVAAGERSFDACVVYTPTDKPVTPCGACRQVLNEFGPSMALISICDSGAKLETTLEALLPYSFGPKNLKVKPVLPKRR